MDNDKVAFNLLYNQAVEDVRTLKLIPDSKREELEEYRRSGQQSKVCGFDKYKSTRRQ